MSCVVAQEGHVAPPVGQIYCFIMSLQAMTRLFYGAIYNIV